MRVRLHCPSLPSFRRPLVSVGIPSVSVLLGFALFACGGDGAGASGEWSVDTLDTGLIRTVNPAAPAALAGAPRELEPLLRIGSADGPDATVFGQVSGVLAGEDGRIYVLDRQANELRVFSPDGEHLRTVGRSGSGPGEYSAANGLRWLPPDTLLVADQSGGRYTLLDGDGTLLGTVRRELGFFSWMFDGNVHDGRILELGPVAQGDGSSRAAIIVTPLGTGADGAALRGDTLPLPPSDLPVVPAFQVRSEVGGMSMAVPHAPRRISHIDDEGFLWHGHGSEFRVFRSTLQGDTLREIQVGIDPEPVAPEEVDEWRAGQSVERFLEMGGDLDMGRIPDVKPFFDAFYRDPDGYLWVSVPTRVGDTRFVVLDPEGRFVADLHLEGMARSPALLPYVRDDRLYLVASDALGVEGVEVFRIVRHGT